MFIVVAYYVFPVYNVELMIPQRPSYPSVACLYQPKRKQSLLIFNSCLKFEVIWLVSL